MSDVTRILSQIEQGDPQAAEKLLPLVYDELRKLAAAKLAQEKPGQTLQATALVHEAYLRLVDGETRRSYRDHKHFFASAATAMRRILVDPHGPNTPTSGEAAAEKGAGRSRRSPCPMTSCWLCTRLWSNWLPKSRSKLNSWSCVTLPGSRGIRRRKFWEFLRALRIATGRLPGRGCKPRCGAWAEAKDSWKRLVLAGRTILAYSCGGPRLALERHIRGTDFSPGS